MPDFGDHVRIKTSDETERLGLAGREGIVFGWTTPSLTRVEVVGQLTEDFAFNVNFEDLNRDVWFAAELVELLDHAPGQVLRLDGVDAEWVRLPSGEWEQRTRGTD